MGKLILLDLSHNYFSASVPHCLGSMANLMVLDLRKNNFTGSLPPLCAHNTSLSTIVLGSEVDLCGPPLSKQCGTSDSSHVPQPLESEEDESESYFFSGFTWESVVIGYSCGLVVGTVMWSLMFKYRKPKWFVEFFDGLMPHERRRPKKRAQRRQT
ncbi:probable inactive leucine-rich repeat receptor-like protein kinase At1g66830 [Solanum tuberosum]|uniref:probable inactive leucine-rich repeat receptor-like protein kinase At1g66830 n=1 Tax=Solanum tuberosum TaxID=4113 RepID=UPI00073A3479|nr:PREDICTED: probable inactive leucine-rich repeat receptor-like protein kinase At1g66830 [Solanum tuberosum]